MKIETITLSELTQDDCNVRSHDERDISAIKVSLEEFDNG